MSKVQKAYIKLKEFKLFSPDFNTFKELFFQNVDKSKKDEALELLLMVVFNQFESEGGRFNELLESIDEATQIRLRAWLDDNYKKYVGDNK